jgi:outer membrane protein assembly factor BamB
MKTLSLIKSSLLMGAAALAIRIAGLLPLDTASAAPESTAPLGSPAFRPTPEQPIGWRGDWTGRYPGATPPIEWTRRVKGITTEIKYQAKKPAGEPGKDALPLEYFTLKDWLVAGPFDADDPKAGIEKDFLGGEAAVQPNDGDKAGSVVWKFDRTTMDTQTTHIHNGGMCRNLNIDYVFLFGKFSRSVGRDKNLQFKIEGEFNNKVAYAHTYIYSPTGGKVALTNLNWGGAAKAWLNGQALPVVVETQQNTWNKKEIEVALARGWNRLLIKVASSDSTDKAASKEGMSNWRSVAYLTPVGPVSYETKNVAWMTRVTGRSMSQPVIVGDKLFFGSGISDLMCVSKADGKVLWIRSNTPWDALTAEEKAQYRDKLEPLVTQLQHMNEQTVAAINATVSPQGMSSDQQAVMDKQLKAKKDLEEKLHKAFESIDAQRFPPLFGNEVASSNAVPCTDGTHIYWACGGGMKGPGASVISCYEPSGKLVWSFHEALGASEHGLHTSPILAEGKLIYGANRTLLALEAATGKVAWRQKSEEYCGSSPQIVRIGGQLAVFSKSHATLNRVSDGTKFAANDIGGFGDETPVVENGVAFIPDRFKGWGDDNVAFTAVQLPGAVADKAPLKTYFELKWAENHVPLRGISYWVASPLYFDGHVYALDMSGGLMIVDVKAQKTTWRGWLDWYCRFDRYLYGAVASPTLGGKNIYLVDDSGYTIIIKPGATYQEVAGNVLEGISPSSNAGNPCHQEAFYTSPVFEGNVIYLKGEEYLYAIRGK